eukprot:CAMPEP_0178519792 /NCGR_PEP_ID=MMETSP0696-20121128/27040_1 /TAXON_ID=265572 /ORGANISM="Extubocellulus spinifer, Strain CCMP396" /LENGTH=166 /DNA_ID=CAMNT_0020150567 /DNA_START=78 /DNA_END=578 /DNA_ORIENTATION=+
MPCPATTTMLARCDTLRRPLPPSSSSATENDNADASISCNRDGGCAPPSTTSSSSSISSSSNQFGTSASAVEDILALSPRRLTRPHQLDVVEASLPYLGISASTSTTTSGPAGAGPCPPLMHSYMTKCIDGALAGRSHEAERTCLAVRETFLNVCGPSFSSSSGRN